MYKAKKIVKFLKVCFVNFENFDSVFRANYPDKEEQTGRNLKEKKIRKFVQYSGCFDFETLANLIQINNL